MAGRSCRRAVMLMFNSGGAMLMHRLSHQGILERINQSRILSTVTMTSWNCAMGKVYCGATVQRLQSNEVQPCKSKFQILPFHISSKLRSNSDSEKTSGEIHSDEETKKLASVDEMFVDITNEELEEIPFDLDYDDYLVSENETVKKAQKGKSKRKRRGKPENDDLMLPNLSRLTDYLDARPCMSVDEVVEHLKETQALDLCVIEVREEQTSLQYVDYFIVVSGRSTRHLKLMAFGLASKYKKLARERERKSTAVVEGAECLDWMAVDIGNMVIHFMLPDTREQFELEKLWTLGNKYDDQYQQMIKEFAHEPLTAEEIQLQFERENRKSMQ